MAAIPKVTNTIDASAWGPILPIVAEKGQIVLDAAKLAKHEITRVYGYNSASTSDHRFRHCIDFMHYGNKTIRLWLESYLMKNYKTLGIMGMISNGRCVGFPSQETIKSDQHVTWNGPEGEWRKYTGTSDMHTDHVHVQFNSAPVKQDGHAVVFSGKLWTLKKVPAYNGNGKRLPSDDLPKGKQYTVKVLANPFGDGRYVELHEPPHAIYFPADSGGWSHTKTGKAI